MCYSSRWKRGQFCPPWINLLSASNVGMTNTNGLIQEKEKAGFGFVENADWIKIIIGDEGKLLVMLDIEQERSRGRKNMNMVSELK